jgi:hypothetical protein
LNFRADRINIFADYSYYYDHTYQLAYNQRTFTHLDTTFTHSSIGNRYPTVINQNLTADDVLLYEQQIRVDKTTPLNGYASKIDYTHTLASYLQVETGIKAAFTSFNNELSTHETGLLSNVIGDKRDETAIMDEQISSPKQMWKPT